MRTLGKLTVGVVVAFGILATIGHVPGHGATASTALKAQEASPTITIKDFMYNPADLNAKVGQSVTIVNDDGFSHTVTATDRTFDVDVPANGSATLMLKKPGSFAYACTYHPGQHNAAKINVS